MLVYKYGGEIAMDNEETIFLAKVQQVMKALDEIDDILDNISEMQSKCDLELSDYYHIIEDKGHSLSNEQKIKVLDKIEELRNIRRNRFNVNQLGQVYRQHSKSLMYRNNRSFVYQQIKNKIKELHKDYNYRILASDDINSLISTTPESKTNDTGKRGRKSKVNISKEELEKYLEEGLMAKEIAKMYNTVPANISRIKKMYGIATKTYKRKGD